jgi:hypothetical protein
LKEIEGDTSLEWQRVAGEDVDNSLEKCTNYEEKRVSELKKDLIKLAKEKCDFVRTYHPLRLGIDVIILVEVSWPFYVGTSSSKWGSMWHRRCHAYASRLFVRPCRLYERKNPCNRCWRYRRLLCLLKKEDVIWQDGIVLNVPGKVIKLLDVV